MNKGNITHPSREQLTDFVAGKLDSVDQTEVESHIEGCAECCEILRSLPDETLIKHMRVSDTLSLEGGTDGVAVAANTGDEQSPKLPPELTNHPKFRIVRQLGAGGMGVVYEAVHRVMERPVALKIISRQLVNNQEAIERFHLEVKAAAMLSHRNIVTAHDADREGDIHFLVMEFVAGTSLSQLVQQRGRLSVLHACNYAMQVAQGLQHASEHGMVHRDIKPQNLMRTPKGTIKILDFGLARMASELGTARLTRAGAALGTADYIAPEQIEDSRDVDIRADIYSLGCTLYFLLTGHVPYPDGSAVDKILAHLKETPRSLSDVRNDVPSEVVRVVERMMARDPTERFQTPAAVVEALKPFGRPRSADEAASIDAAQPTTGPNTNFPAEADPLGIAMLNQPIETVLAMGSSAPRRPRGQQHWLRYAGACGALALLVIGGFLLKPVFQNQFVGGEPSSGWIDLMSNVDPAMNSVRGQWQKDGNELSVNAEEFAWLVLPYDIPEEYDFDVTFTRTSGMHSIALFFVAGGGQATYEVDAWGQHMAGIQNIGGRTMEDPSVPADSRTLENGRRYKARVEVRRGQVTTYLDDKLVATYEGNGVDLSIFDKWEPRSNVLGVGAYESETIFHSLRVRER